MSNSTAHFLGGLARNLYRDTGTNPRDQNKSQVHTVVDLGSCRDTTAAELELALV
jgi:hypothetical protein